MLLLQTTNIDQEYSFQSAVSRLAANKNDRDLKANPVWKTAASSGGWTEVNIEQIFDWNPDDIFCNKLLRTIK